MKNENKRFPLFMDLTKKRCVVIGAGRIASRRTETILPFVGDLLVIAPKASQKIIALAGEGVLTYLEKSYEKGDLSEADLVLIATDDRAVNDQIYEDCRELGILVNTASDQRKCDFHFPAVIEKEPLVIGINGGGTDHRLVKQIRQKLQEFLEDLEGKEKQE